MAAPSLPRLRSTKESKRLSRLKIKEYRSEISKENTVVRVAIQIKLMREAAGLSQAELAEKIGTKQSAIARIESSNYGKFSISMLQKIADYFDVVAWIEFAPFSTFVRRTSHLSPEKLTPLPYEYEFDEHGEPRVVVHLALDGSPICQTNYLREVYVSEEQPATVTYTPDSSRSLFF